MRADASAFYSYPSAANRCYRCKRPVTPELVHQEAYCLQGGHRDCRAYLQAQGKAFPRDLRTGAVRRGTSASPALGLLFAAIVLAAIGFAAWRLVPPMLAGGFRLPFAVPLVAPSQTVIPTVTAAPEASPSHEPTSTSAPTPVPSPERYALDVPFQVGGLSLLLHRVGGGETFEIIDTKYETTSAVVRALNPSIQEMLLANSVIVISPGRQSAGASLPAFRVHTVDEPTATIEHVAGEYHVDPALLRYYNPCSDSCTFQSGDWLLIPVATN